MANFFYSGTKTIPVGATEVAVTGLALSFTPQTAVVSLRQPTADAPIISGFVAGAVTADGFTAVLSVPPAVEGYILDYSIFSAGGVSPVAGDTLAVDYQELVKIVGKFLGYDTAALTEGQAEEVDSYIQSGIRNFYHPPKTADGVDENFEWSFLRQAGTLDTSAGLDSYLLPNGFGRIEGQITVEGDNGLTIPVIPYGEIMRMKMRPETGRPRFACTIYEKDFGSRGQKKRLYLYPAPDREYVLHFSCDADEGKIDAENRPFPLGGALFSELVIESCLAVAEQRANDEEGLHTKKFTELLLSSVARDRKSSAQEFGDIGDPDARMDGAFRPLPTRGCLY